MSTDDLLKEITKVKAIGFDALIELNAAKEQIKMHRHVFFVMASKLGCQDITNLSIEDLPALLDKRIADILNESKSTEQE